ncbi:uncharacterized protein LOC132195251 [Neocloeon triangulifer]|uniref:uncharacterized protein LOC132195251 n=1 Tax=Neocloeon triangulifer TaxID=2078957 RepID=UPI00286F5DDD|nr:uncharacterized protein LOC132195251 [Neocloeon triangulifer]
MSGSNMLQVVEQIVPFMEKVDQAMANVAEIEKSSRKRKAATADLLVKKICLLKKVKKALRGKVCTPAVSEAVKNQGKGFWEEVLPHLTDENFQEIFVLTKEAFYELAGEIKPYFYAHKAIPVAKKVAIAIYVLRGSYERGQASDLFHISRSDAESIFVEFCRVVSKFLFLRYLQFPDLKEQLNIAEDFMKLSQFPNTFGSVGLIHIPIKTPSESAHIYENKKDFYSMIVLAAVDAKGRFIYLNIQRPGKEYDAEVYFYSNLSIPLLYNQEKTNPELHVVGRRSLPLEMCLMTPYCKTHFKSAEEDFREKFFNRRLHNAQIVIDDAFGRLLGRFRIIMSNKKYGVSTMIKIITTSVILHNICEEKAQLHECRRRKSKLSERPVYPGHLQESRSERPTALEKRDFLANFLLNYEK